MPIAPEDAHKLWRRAALAQVRAVTDAEERGKQPCPRNPCAAHVFRRAQSVWLKNVTFKRCDCGALEPFEYGD